MKKGNIHPNKLGKAYSCFYLVLFIFTSPLISQTNQKIIGRITDGFDPVYGVKVEVIDMEIVTQSDVEGNYEIYASPGSELLYTRVGFDSLSIITEDVTSRLNIVLNRTVEELDEVTVTDKRIPRQKRWAMNYYSEPSIINTGRGYLNNRESAFHFYVLDKDEINFAAPDIVSVINGRIPGARVKLSYTGERYLILRSNGSLRNEKGPVYEVDGVLFTQTPTWLILDNIIRIGVIPGLHASLIYGSVASGGLVVINTVNGSHGLREEGSSEFYDQALLRNNLASDQYLTESDIIRNASKFMMELYASSTSQNALEIIGNYEGAFSKDAYFFLEGYKFLFENEGKREADSLLQAHWSLFKSNPVYLKALAFSYEEQLRNKKAHEVYKMIFKLRPEYAQSYIDIANSYFGQNEFDKSYRLLMRYINLITGNLMETDTVDLASLLENEIKSANAKQATFQNEDVSTRLVFQWNDGEAEFDLQFINPQNHYYTWEHSLATNPERIYREKIYGFTTQEYLLDYSLPGVWEVRCSYHGNKKLTPTYLKVYIYHHFGTPKQTRETRVFRLDLIGPTIQLFKFNVPSNSIQAK